MLFIHTTILKINDRAYKAGLFAANANASVLIMRNQHRELFPEDPVLFLDTSSETITEDEILEYLARIITDIYIKNHQATQHEAAPLLEDLDVGSY